MRSPSRVVLMVGTIWLWPWGLAAAAETPRRYDGCQVARVWGTDEQALAPLLARGADLWTEHVGRGPVDVLLPPGMLAELEGLGVPYHVWIEDVQHLIDTEQAAAPRGWFDAYHAYDDIVTYLNQLAASYPDLAAVINVGTSLEGRTIWGLRIAGPALPPTSPAVVYFAGLHAREWIGPTVPQYVATHLLANYGLDPAITDVVDHVEWFLIPVGNPDGYVYTWTNDRLWRKNRRDNGGGVFGVDINRNFGMGWGLNGSSGLPSSQTYRGPAPFSEPETQALRDFFIAHPQVRAMNDIHSYSQLILWPWGYKPELPPDQPAYQAVGLAMQQLIQSVHGLTYTAGPIYSTIYPVSGGSADWTYGVRDIFSFSFELRDTGTYGFILPASQIIPNNEEVLPALLHLTNSAMVRATQFRFPDGLPAQLVVGADTPIAVTITSADEVLDVGTALLHYRYHADEAFTVVPLTHLGGASFLGTLPRTHCGATPEYYFSVVGDAGVTLAPAGAPGDLYAAGMVSGTTVFEDDLAANPGWSTQAQWAWGQPTGGGGAHGGPDPTSGHTGPYVYGYNLAGDYTNSLPERHLTSLPFDCRGQWGLRLSFWRWLGVEQAPYDRAAVGVSRDGVNWVTVWQNTTEVADNVWTLQDFDISAEADNQPTVYLRWTMGPTDAGWAYCGWNVDDVQVYATGCAELPGDVNCDGRLDFRDINPFVLALTNPVAYAAAFPHCDVNHADCNGDGSVGFGDINAFVLLLSGP